jgi:hypothetical protein
VTGVCGTGQQVMVEGGGYVCVWTQCPKPPEHHGLALIVVVLWFVALVTVVVWRERL